MRFTLFKLSAFALVATSMVSAEKSALRGPVVSILFDFDEELLYGVLFLYPYSY
jgi:hypothetical protein